MFNINLHRNTDPRISWLFILLLCLFLSCLPRDVIGVANELKVIIEGIKFSESFLLNGRIELSSRLEIINEYDDSGAATQGYLMNQDFIWVFKDKKWRLEQQMKDFRGEYYNIQVFDGEKKTDLIISSDTKMATISNDNRYTNPPHTRAYGSPSEYMLNLFIELISEDLKKCLKIELIGTEKIDGIDCSVIKLVYDKEYSGSLWVAPSRGYRVIKSEVHVGNFQLVIV